MLTLKSLELSHGPDLNNCWILAQSRIEQERIPSLIGSGVSFCSDFELLPGDATKLVVLDEYLIRREAAEGWLQDDPTRELLYVHPVAPTSDKAFDLAELQGVLRVGQDRSVSRLDFADKFLILGVMSRGENDIDGRAFLSGLERGFQFGTLVRTAPVSNTELTLSLVNLFDEVLSLIDQPLEPEIDMSTEIVVHDESDAHPTETDVDLVRENAVLKHKYEKLSESVLGKATLRMWKWRNRDS